MKLGRYSHIGADTMLYFNADVEAGNFVAIADNVTFCGIMNYPWVVNRQSVNVFPFGVGWGGSYDKGISRGKIIIGNDIWIGHKAIILDGVTIGDGAIVGLGSVVSKNVPPYAVVAGNPAEIKHYRFTSQQIEKLLEIKWWNWNDQTIKERIEDFNDVSLFIKKYE